MFSKSKRFNQSVPSTPAVGQYDVTNTPYESAGCAVVFPKDKRFKESVVTNGNQDTSLLDISNCSIASTKSSVSNSCNLVFATPGKPCGKAKITLSTPNNLPSRKYGSHNDQPVAENNQANVAVEISILQEEIERLRSENYRLQESVAENNQANVAVEISKLQEEIERLRSENERLQKSVAENNQANVAVEISKLQEEIERHRSENERLQKSVAENNQANVAVEISKLQEEIERHRSENERLQKSVAENNQANVAVEISKLQEEIERHRSENERLQKSVAENNQANVAVEISKLQEEIERHRSENERLQKPVAENNQANVAVEISKLQEEIDRLRSENERLQKLVQDTGTDHESIGALNARIVSLLEEVERLHNENNMLNTKLSELESSSHERQSLQSNLSALNDELGKLRVKIDEEILRNKEMLLQQSKYECSIETLQADLDLANSQVKVLQGQINLLEQDNADISEDREDLETQCTKLHGMTIALQQDNLTLQEQLDDVENTYKNMKSSKDDLEKEMSSYMEQYASRVESLEYTLYEKVTTLTALNEQRKVLEETLDVNKNNVATLERDLAEAVDMQKKTDIEMNILKEDKQCLAISMKDLGEKHEQVVDEAQQEVSQLRDEMRRKDEQSLQNLQSITRKCEILEEQLVALEKDRSLEIGTIQKELELSKESFNKTQDEYRTLNLVFKDMKKDYNMECKNRLEMQQELYRERESWKKVNEQLIESQGHIAKLQESEKEQRTTAEILSTKLAECNLTINDMEKKIVGYQDVVEENISFRGEIETLEELLSKLREENKSFANEEKKAGKLKQEIGRRLVETQKKLSQKEIDLHSCKKEFEDYVLQSKDEESWKRKYKELEERIAPFQDQLDAYEFEKQALLSRNSESQSEVQKLGQQYAKLLGHQNQKQKIRHVLKLKDENTNLKKEVARLQEDFIKQKQSIRKLEAKLDKATGMKRFDTSLAFKHNAVENKENTPLKTRPK